MQNCVLISSDEVKQIIAEKFGVDVKNVIKSQYSYTVITGESNGSMA